MDWGGNLRKSTQSGKPTYSIVEIFDDYNFPEEAQYTFDKQISEKLNAMWYYYESNLKWQTYDFIIQIKEKIN